jgi:4-amino-4-deoxy-L-arabinose transferase-like glycosyltransferase
VFLFFSKSQSKLIPYILPVFPPLAVLLGGWLARRWADGAGRQLRLGLNIFSFVSGLLAVALVVAVLKPGLIREPGQAELLRPYAFGMAAVLLLGGVAAPWFGRVGGPRSALSTMVSTAVGLYCCLMLAAPYIQKPGTKELAEIVVQKAKAGDKVYHYAEFFHDFTFYAHQTVGTVAFKGELELEIDAAARASGRFIDGPEFRRQWAGTGRVFAVARTKDLKELFADPTFRYHLLGQSRAHTLFSNQP